MTPVNSSQIAAVDHDGDKLIVQFHSGGTYEYAGVPREIYDKMMADHAAGGSIGKMFGTLVKKAGFKHTKR